MRVFAAADASFVEPIVVIAFLWKLENRNWKIEIHYSYFCVNHLNCSKQTGKERVPNFPFPFSNF